MSAICYLLLPRTGGVYAPGVAQHAMITYMDSTKGLKVKTLWGIMVFMSIILLSSPSICQLIHAAKFHFANEYDLQAGIAQLLTEQGVQFQREVSVAKTERLDFLTAEGIAIEVKVDGALSSVTRQLFRYAAKPEIRELILVTTRTKHRTLPQNIQGKPLYIVHLSAF
jgi:hypothetical protein